MPKNGTQLTSAVAYIRMSTDDQADSPDQQREAIERYAKENGFQIVRYYEDEGVPGNLSIRKGFDKMLADAQNARDFEAILIWDISRFSRSDPVDAFFVLKPLRDAGVDIIPVSGERVDLQSFNGRIKSFLEHELKHQQVRDLSRDTLRGQISIAKRGYLCGQAAPYGYDRMLVDEHSQPQQRIHNGEVQTKPRAWHVTLVPSNDPDKLSTVRYVFETYANEDIGTSKIAETLNDQGIPSPTGKKWSAGTIQAMLKNQAYIGNSVWGKRSEGKYHKVGGDRINPRDRVRMTNLGNVAVTVNPIQEWIVAENAWPAIVDKPTFEKAQAKLAQRKHRNGRNRTTNPDRYLLSGIVQCAHCGRKMHGTMFTKSKAGKTYAWLKYVCPSYNSGKGPCSYHTIEAPSLDAYVRSLLQKLATAPENKDRVRQAILVELQSRSVKPQDLGRKRKQLQKLDRQIETAIERYLELDDPALIKVAKSKLNDLQRQRNRLAEELKSLEQAMTPVDLERDVERIMASLEALEKDLADAKPARLKELLGQVLDRIELHFDRVQKGKRTQCRFSWGKVHLRGSHESQIGATGFEPATS